MMTLACSLFSDVPSGEDPAIEAESTQGYHEELSEESVSETQPPESLDGLEDFCLNAYENIQIEIPSDYASDIDADFYDEEGLTLASYEIIGEKIMPVESAGELPDWLVAYRDDSAYHQELWELVSNLLPEAVRPYLKGFHIHTDGLDQTLASVYMSDDDMEAWILDVDILDSANTGYFIETIVHEFSHLITLSPQQVTPNQAVFSDPENEEVYAAEQAACPTYFPDGCSRADSYINLFHERFWEYNAFYPEWEEINSMDYGEEYDNALYAFYENYQIGRASCRERV